MDEFPKPNVARIEGRRSEAGGDGSSPEPRMSASGGGWPRVRRQPDFPTLVRRVIAAGWRRRWLILVPILLMIPIGWAAATLLPQTYVVRTLLLLQEGTRDNPLARETAQRSVIQERVAGLGALLRSDQVLTRVIEDLVPNGSQLSPRQMAIRLNDLRSELTLELIGSDFIEIRLRTSQASSARVTLETIVTHFLDALVVGRQGQSAASFLIDQKSAELEAARQARNAAAARLARAREADAPDAALVEDLQQREERLAAAEADYAVYAERYGRAGEPGAVGILQAPERVVVFDPPRDPHFPMISRMLYMGSALGAGILLGVILAFAAEWLNARVRDPDELEALTGVPVLGTLPVFSAASRSANERLVAESRAAPIEEAPATAAAKQGRRRRRALPAAVLVVALVASFLLVSTATVGFDRGPAVLGDGPGRAVEPASSARPGATHEAVVTARIVGGSPVGREDDH